VLDFQKLTALYQQALLRQVVPFWLKNSRDMYCGGYFDLLSATGEVIEGDKFVTHQAQQTWAFAWLYNNMDGQSAWLEHAQHGAAFLYQFARTDTLSCHAQLDRRGRPVAAATNVIPDCSTAMAYAQLHQATGNDEWAMLAKQIALPLLQRWEENRIHQIEQIDAFRQIRHLSEPVALLKMLLDMQPLMDEDYWKQRIELLVQEILNEFVDKRTDILREYILPEGSFINTPEGRRINVGLTFQTASYLLDFCAETTPSQTGQIGNKHRKLAMQVVQWCLRLCAQSWDELGGGLNQFIDFKQQPVLFPEWQQKWGWVHAEALVALLKCYFYTRQPECLTWFKRVSDYTFQRFPDPKQTGWHLVIDQHGQPLVNAKSIPSVGCYSSIRCLTEVSQLLTKCEQSQSKAPVRSSKSLPAFGTGSV
jgi:N-acylglucosamine 2-epimerase